MRRALLCLLASLTACDGCEEEATEGCPLDEAALRAQFGDGERVYSFDEMSEELVGRCDEAGSETTRCVDQPLRVLRHNTGYVGFTALYDESGELVHVGTFWDDIDEECHGLGYWPTPTPEGGACTLDGNARRDLCPEGSPWPP